MPPALPDWTKKFGYGEFIHLEHRNCQACMMKGEKVFRVVEDNCYKEENRFADMQNTGVTTQVITAHLTWTGGAERPGYPHVTRYADIWAWLKAVVDETAAWCCEADLPPR